MRFPPLILVLLLLLLAACEYKPKGEYFSGINPKPPPEVTIAIQGQSDTLVIINFMTYKVDVSCGTNSVLFHRVYIDGGLETTQESHNSFSIYPLDYIHDDGIYRLTVEVGINNGSGSIADVLGAEGYLFQREFILVVLREQVGFYPQLEFDRSNGAMKVFMNVPSNVPNVRKVVFSRSVGTSPKVEFASVIGGSYYQANDPLYVGEEAVYSVQTYIGEPSGTIFHPFVSGSDRADADLPVVTAGVNARGFTLVHWNKTHYPANCGGYRVYGQQFNTGSSDFQLYGTIGNQNDTTFEPPGVAFPGYYGFRVAPVPFQVPAWFTDDLAWNEYANGANIYTGLNSFSFSRCYTPDVPYIYYSATSNVINEYSLQTGTITDIITTSTGWFYTMAVSPNGKYLLAATGTSNFSYLFYDLETNQPTLVPSSQVIGAGSETGIISIADNGIASIITGTRMVVYDFLHQAAVTQQNLPTWGVRTVISADGQYIFTEAGTVFLFKLVAGTLQQQWVSSPQIGQVKYYIFEPSRPSMARILIDQVMYTRNCDTWATENSFTAGFDNIYNIDFTNGLILAKTATHFKVVGLNTGSVLFQNPTTNNSLTTDLRIKQNTVYHSSGKKLIIF